MVSVKYTFLQLPGMIHDYVVVDFVLRSVVTLDLGNVLDPDLAIVVRS